VKFTDRGLVALRVDNIPDAVAQESGKARLRFEVEDSGVGIAGDKIEAVFRPFEQVGEMRRRSGGTGLGLSISRQLIRVMGGEVQVHSDPGQGSCFWFELVLPLAEAAPPAPPTARTVMGYKGPRKRVLVIDDVDANRALIAAFLEPLGFELAEAVNGMQGLEMARTQPPDLVLMDLFMPVMDGLEAMQAMRRETGLQDMPIICISAIATSADRSRSLTAGASAFLAKPLDLDQLTTEIGRLLKLSWVFDEARNGDVV
jgi:CheY-like chemotaxis protein